MATKRPANGSIEWAPRIASSSSISRGASASSKRSAASRWRSCRRDVRPARSQRRGQDDDAVHARHPAARPPAATCWCSVRARSAIRPRCDDASDWRRSRSASTRRSPGRRTWSSSRELHGVAPAVRRRRVEQLLELVGLAPRRDDRGTHLLGRHAAAPQPGLQPDPRAAPAAARRTHRRGRPTVAREPLRGDPADRVRGHDDRLHDPLHRGGRAVVRPHRDPRRGTHRRRGHAAGAARNDRHGGSDRDSRRRDRRACAAPSKRSRRW